MTTRHLVNRRPGRVGTGVGASRRYLGDFLTAPRYDAAMATKKVSVTLEAAAIEQARHAAGPRGLSSYLDAALREKLERDERRTALLVLLEELEASDPIPPAIRARGAERAARLRAVVDR